MHKQTISKHNITFETYKIKKLSILALFFLALTVPTLNAKPDEVFLTKPFEPVFINQEAPYPYDGYSPQQLDILQEPSGIGDTYGDVKCWLETGKKYHIFLVGDFVYNKTLGSPGLTDYDVTVYGPSGQFLSRHTESAGQPEQVFTNGNNHQYFIPPDTGTYTFRIFNDPEDSWGEDPAVFMIIEHIEMNQVYEVTLYGKPEENANYHENFNYGYEFDTPAENFELFVKVPDPNPTSGYRGLDMYEARVYPMANPQEGIGHYIWGLGVPYGKFLEGEFQGSYGNYNVSIEGPSYIDYTASCEFNGEDMRVVFGRPEHNGTEPVYDDPTVFYYLVLLAEYDQGTVEFYLKTDYRQPNITLTEPLDEGYTGEETSIKVNIDAYHSLEKVAINYTIDNWKTMETLDLKQVMDYYEVELPEFDLNDTVKYKVYAIDKIDNRGALGGNFTVKNRVDLNLYSSRESITGGYSLKIFGDSTIVDTVHNLVFESGNYSQTIKVSTDDEGRFEYDYKPPSSGEFTARLVYEGDPNTYPATSEDKEFLVEKTQFVISFNIEDNPAKTKKPLVLSGNIQPPMPDVSLSIILVSPEGSFEESVTTTKTGSFTTTITPISVGGWEALPQIHESNYFMPAQGSLKSFEVIPLSIVEKIVMKAPEFLEPPLVAIPSVLFLGVVGVAERKTSFLRKSAGKLKEKAKPLLAQLRSKLNRKNEPVEERVIDEPVAPEPDVQADAGPVGGVTSYKRRSMRTE